MIGRTLAHYRVLAELGVGGMGEVYRATDTKLGRDVALKVLPPAMAASADRLERFRREAKALAALDHPGIVTVFSVEEAASVHFLTMQLIDGQALDRAIPDGGLPIQRVLDIAHALADALAAAHDKGIVHRDLKPANVMITTDGRVKVLDFGLVKELREADPMDVTLTSSPHTEIGVVMGTPAYMSPEQVVGGALDHRTDIFSLGVLLYEMVTGQRPFQGRSSAETTSAILRDTPAAVTAVRADVPGDLARIIRRCLKKDPRHRIQTARDVANELRDLARHRSAPEAPAAPLAPRAVAAPGSGASRTDEGFRVAVLPFKYTGANADLAALAEGLCEEIVTGLSRFSYLRVIARGSALGTVTEGADARDAGKAIGARYVMEGSLRQAGAKLRVAVQLVDVTTGAHLWAETYERAFSPDALFELQDDLVPRIVSTVADMHGVLPRSMSGELRSRPAEQLSPYEAVLRSFGYFERVTAEELAAARAGLELAVGKAPGYADAWAMLALLGAQEFGQDFRLQADPLATAASAARKAVECGPSNHLAHFSLAQVLFFQKEFPTFRNAAARAAALNPMDGNAIAFLGELLTYAGDSEQGLALSGRAKQLNPHHPGWYWYADVYYAYHQGDYRGTVELARKVNMPGHWGGHVMIAAACGQLGEREAAGRALRDLLGLRPDFAAIVRAGARRWWDPEYVERLIDGLRKAGLEVEAAPGDAHTHAASTGPAAASDAGSGSSPKTSPEAAVAIAVLPFTDMSPARDQDYLCEGMAEEVMNALVRVEGIRVASRASAFRAHREGRDVPAIARALSVGHILDGSVRTSGSRLRVTAQLTDVATGFHLWSERFDREAADVFAVQDEIAAGVVEAVKARLAPGSHALPARPPARNLEAYRCYLRGRHLRHTIEDHAGALRAFEEAIRLDPSHAPSWTGLAEIYVLAAHFSLVPAREACAAARAALATAEGLQGESADARYVEGFAAFIERRWQAMEVAYRRAIDLQPRHVQALGSFGVCLSARQRFQEAPPFFKRAEEADPLAAFPYSLTGGGLLGSGRPVEALASCEDALSFEKDNLIALYLSAIALVRLGRTDEGIARAERAVAVSQRGPHFLGVLGWVLATSGRGDAARTILEELRARPAGAPTVVSEGWLLGALGETDAAFEVLARAEDECQAFLYYTGLPVFDPLRADPRFAALLARLKLPPEGGHRA